MPENLHDLATHSISRDGLTHEGVAAAFAGTLADELDHHPRIVLDSAGLTLTIRDRETRKVTIIDLVFAARLEQWLRNNGWPPS